MFKLPGCINLERRFVSSDIYSESLSFGYCFFFSCSVPRSDFTYLIFFPDQAISVSLVLSGGFYILIF